MERIGRERFQKICGEHGYEKILFATDSPWTDQSEEIARLKSYGLSPEAEKAILGGNAAKLLDCGNGS
jgi:hypothetical protein